MQRAKLTDGRTRLVIAVVAVDVEGFERKLGGFSVFHKNRAEFKGLPSVLLFKLVGDQALFAGAVCLCGEIALFIHDQQMMLLDVLAAQHFAVADDDAFAMIAAEVCIDRQHRRIAACDVADGFVDAAAEIIAGKRGAQLADVGSLDVADEVRHAVLLFLFDGDLELVRFIG